MTKEDFQKAVTEATESAVQRILGKPLNKWLKEEEAARYIGCDPTTLKKWRTKGFGPRFKKISNRFVRYSTDDLDAFLNTEGELRHVG